MLLHSLIHRDLFGAVSNPLTVTRTIITGKNVAVICRLLYVISYFIHNVAILANIYMYGFWCLLCLHRVTRDELGIQQCPEFSNSLSGCTVIFLINQLLVNYAHLVW